MTFKEIEWEKEFKIPYGAVRYKRYGDKMFWWNEFFNEWMEVIVQPEYDKYEYI